MDELRLSELADRVVAWHNRHPLARRIRASQVQAQGYVALPYVALDGASATAAAPAAAAAAPASEEPPVAGGTLRERALARAQERQQAQASAATAPAETAAAAADASPGAAPALPPAGLKAAFSEDFIAPLDPARVARWVLRQGRRLATAPSDGPVRWVAADASAGAAAPLLLYALTAAIEVGTSRSRVLVGAGSPAAVLGRRLWSRPRLATAGLAPLLLATAIALALARPHGPADAPEAAPVLAAGPSPAASAERAAAPQTSAPEPAEAAPESAAEPATDPPAPPSEPEQASAEPVAAPPAIALSGLISDEAKALARQERRARAAASAPGATAARDAPAAALSKAEPAVVAAAAPHAEPTPKTAAPEPATPARAAGSATFAVSTRPLRTHAEAEQVKVAMAALLRTIGAAAVRVEVLPQGDDWRVVGWPYAQRGEAERARALLVSRGMRTEVIDF